MKIIDLSPELENLYFCCLEDWSDEMKEAGNHKQCWYNSIKDKGLRVKLAQDDNGKIGGMIQYLPIEHSYIEGKNLYFILCIWVHGYKQGRGDFRKKGMGKALLKAAEEDVKQLGASGIVAWGIWLPFFIRAAWFRKHGYKRVDKYGIVRLLWKPFLEDAIPPKFIKLVKKPKKVNGKVAVASFIHGWCPAMNIVHERSKKAALEIGDKIEFQEFHTSNQQLQREWGIVDGLFIDGKQIRTGPPPSYNKIKKLISKKVRKLN